MKINETITGLFSMVVENYIKRVTEGMSREDMPYIVTYTGKKFRHLEPHPEDVCIEDIAHALSRLCRFTGHMDVPHYSVAQHAVLVSYLCPPKDALWGLHHDDSEAYCADISSPFKHLPGMEGYRLYEKKAMAAICQRFGLSKDEPDSVKKADRSAGIAEMRDLFSYVNGAMQDAITELRKTEFPIYVPTIVPMTAQSAEIAYLHRHYELLGIAARLAKAV